MFFDVPLYHSRWLWFVHGIKKRNEFEDLPMMHLIQQFSPYIIVGLLSILYGLVCAYLFA